MILKSGTEMYAYKDLEKPGVKTQMNYYNSRKKRGWSKRQSIGGTSWSAENVFFPACVRAGNFVSLDGFGLPVPHHVATPWCTNSYFPFLVTASIYYIVNSHLTGSVTHVKRLRIDAIHRQESTVVTEEPEVDSK